jgi:hypothetical protein
MSANLNEVWKPVADFEGLYEVSNFGKVRSLYRNGTNGKCMMAHHCRGYERVNLWKNGQLTHKLVHRMVAEAFIPNPENKPQVNHINGNKADNNVSNLEWVTASENQIHARVSGLNSCVRNNPIHSKPVEMHSVKGELLKVFPSAAEAERQTQISHCHIVSCCAGKYGFKTAGGYVWKYHSGGDADALQNG